MPELEQRDAEMVLGAAVLALTFLSDERLHDAMARRAARQALMRALTPLVGINQNEEKGDSHD